MTYTPLSPLLESELADADALVRASGWNQTVTDWRMFLAFGTVLAVRDATGRVIATAATLPYGGRFAWVSMVLVSAEHRRKGLATQLLNRCIADITGAGLVPVLDATPDGREVYRRLGFQDSWGFQRLAAPQIVGMAEAVPPPPEGVDIGAITDAVWPALCAYDAAAFGADRGALLSRMRGRLPAADLVVTRGGRVVGFLLGRDGRSAAQVGPLVAEDERIAQALLARALSRIDGAVYVDLADAKADTRAWLERLGFKPQRPLTRMLLGRSESFDDTTRTFVVVGPEFG